MNGGSTLYADPTQLEAWLARARPGDRMIYARGPALDPRHAVAALVARWSAEGEVLTLKQRIGGELAHMAQRARPRPAGAVPARRLRRDAEFEETPAGRLFLHLARLANMGLPCPSNRELAEAAGLRDAEAARYLFNKLRAEGRIAVVSTGERRVVTIAETGARTADCLPYRVET